MMFFNSGRDLVLQQLWHMVREGCETRTGGLSFGRYLSFAIDSSDKTVGSMGISSKNEGIR